MPIREMQRFAELVRQGDGTFHGRLKLLESHQRKLQAQLAEIRETLELLEHKVTTYRDLTNVSTLSKEEKL